MSRRRSGPSKRYDPDPVETTSYVTWQWAILAVVVFVLFGYAIFSGLASTQGTAEFDPTVVESAAIERINDARAKQGLPPLTESGELSTESRDYSSEMASADKLEHGEVACAPGGENIAQTHYLEAIETKTGVERYTTSEELGAGIAEQWLNSPGHRENIMNRQFETVGVGVVKTDSKIWATQRFCG